MRFSKAISESGRDTLPHSGSSMLSDNRLVWMTPRGSGPVVPQTNWVMLGVTLQPRS